MRNHPLLKGVTCPTGSAAAREPGRRSATASGLAFIGGGDGYVYAVRDQDRRAGAAIPFNNTANPMTYARGRASSSW